MLAIFAKNLKPVKLLGPCKRTQHCWPKTPNNTQQCDLLRPFAQALRAIPEVSITTDKVDIKKIERRNEGRKEERKE